MKHSRKFAVPGWVRQPVPLLMCIAAALLFTAGLLLLQRDSLPSLVDASSGAEQSAEGAPLGGASPGEDSGASGVLSSGAGAPSKRGAPSQGDSGVLTGLKAFQFGSAFGDNGLHAKRPVVNPYAAAPVYDVSVAVDGDSAELSVGGQKIRFSKNSSGQCVLTTYVKKGGQWTEFFDSGLPIVQGRSFNNFPTSCEVDENSAGRKALLLTGHNASKGYSFRIVAEASPDSPLIHFTITYSLNNALVMSGAEPKIMLWRNGVDANRLTLNQEVPNYQTLDDSVYWKSGFPATYFYTDGMESAVYFDMTPMTWYSMKGGVRRFAVSQARTVASGGMTGSGMDLRGSTDGAVIKGGDMVIDFYLYGSGASKPTKLDALGTMVDVFGHTLPSSAPWHKNYVDSSRTTYADYVAEITRGLMAEGITYRYQPVKARNGGRAIWTDGPLFTERTVSTILQRPGYALKDTSGASSIYGDWNCNNNTLIPWLIFERLNPSAAQRAFVNKGLEGMLTYYDYKTKLIRSFEEQPGYTGNGLEFTFQNFFMQQGTLWASSIQRSEDFDPALGGKFLQSIEGLMALADNCDYVFPQLFYASTLSPAPSIDEPHLGTTYDVWTGAIYSYNMCLAYDLTGDARYLTEAKNALSKLFNGMSFYSNSLKQRLYTDPYDFPVNEVSSAPWGVAAANLLYDYTGDAKWLAYARHIQNLSLRMMNWFESGLRDDPIDQSVASLALFHAFSVVDTTCTWENIMTYMPMITSFKNIDLAPDATMLKLFNLYRINAFNFCGPSWNPDTVPTARQYTSSPAGWLAVEDYYSAETPTPMGKNGPNTYMSNGPMYNYILFEAYAKAADRGVMALNLDIVDAARKMAEGVERNFIFYNGTSAKSSTKLVFHDLHKDAPYQLTTIDSAGKKTVKTYTGKALMDGVACVLKARDYIRVSLICADKAKVSSFKAMHEAQNALVRSYANLQKSALSGITDALLTKKRQYTDALALYREGKYAQCSSKLKGLY